MIQTFAKASEYPLQFMLCIILALIPTFVWFFIFSRRHTHRWKHVLLTFVAGMGAAAIILGYQYFWEIRFDFIFFSIEANDFDANIRSQVSSILLATLLIFFSVGFLEEYAKHWIVKKTDKTIFESIDDVIEFSIIGALGFAFLENIGYFFMILVENNGENLVSLFMVRSLFVVFVHVLCSGIYGYYYGLGHFSEPLLKEWEKEGRIPRFPRIIHRITHMRKDRVFRDEMTTFGLFVAVAIHGAYDFLLEMGTFGQLISLFAGHTVSFPGENIQIHIFVLPALLIFGYLHLSSLLQKKEDQKRRGHIIVREDYIFGDKKAEQAIQ